MSGLLTNMCTFDTWEELKETLDKLLSCLQDRRLGMMGMAIGTAMLCYATRKSKLKQNEMILKEESLENYPSLWNHTNLMAKHLTPELYVKLINRKTRNGFTLDQAIQTGVDRPHHPHIPVTGIVAGDEESYHVFSELFDRIIEERHNGYKRTSTHYSDTNPVKLKHGKFDENFVFSCRIRACRSLKGFTLSPICTRKERRCIEGFIKSILGTMQGDFEGHYYALSSLTEEDHPLIYNQTSLDEPNTMLFTSSGSARDWPDARGIWYTNDKSFMVKVNHEDHLKVIAIETGGDLEKVYERFHRGLKELESLVEASGGVFMRDHHLGNITTCPSNLGTALRVSALVKLPLLGEDHRFTAILCALRLQKRGTTGSESLVQNGVYDISNADRLGYTEVQLVQKLIDGVNLLVLMEKRLQRSLSLSDLVPFKL